MRKITQRLVAKRIIAGFAISMLLLSKCPGQELQNPADPANTSSSEGSDDLDSLLDMADQDVESLSRVNVTAPALQEEVSSVSRQKSTIGRSPAAVFVITNEMIRRSTARSIPEVLRMAPGIQVARIDSSKWAISSRGFNGRFTNSLLVQIDGRTVYTPLFAGVFWDVQDTLLEDVERIEVIRGPGATVWGANAVNGIINIITKSAHDTTGAFAQAGGGTEERGFASARYGNHIGENATYRVYGKWFDRDSGYLPGAAAVDDWQMSRTGFRMDWNPTCDDHITFQGDYYNGVQGQSSIYPDRFPPFFGIREMDQFVAGGNGLFRWTRNLGEDSDWSLQAYYDRTERHYTISGFGEDRDTIDVDFQHRLPVGSIHNLIWGVGYRNSRDETQGSPFYIEFDPPTRADDMFSYFLQDEITLREDEWYLTVGSKFVHSDYTPFEYQPTARILWLPDERHSVWAAVSRAVRLPSRADHDVILTLPQDPLAPGAFPRVTGNDSFVSEDLLAWECGMRAQPSDNFSWDLALFYHQYHDLSTIPPGALVIDPGPPPAAIVPLNLTNGGAGETYGAELFLNYQLTPNWRLFGSYSYLRMFTGDGGNGEPGDNPSNQMYAQSSWDLGGNWEADMIWRYVDVLSNQNVPKYNVMDVRIAWGARPGWELAIVGRDLLDAEHPEFGNDPFTGNIATQVQRGVYGTITWRR